MALSLLVACSTVEKPTPAPTTDPASVYRPITNIRQTMEWILDPAVDVIWDSAGFIITEEGERDLSPTTDEGWNHVRNSAATVTEVGNLLLMPGRNAGPEWTTYARNLIGAGVTAIAAAEAQDAKALFDAGGDVYQACRSCHAQFLIPLEDARSPE